MFFKAVVVISIALAFVMPGAAMVTEKETKEIIQPAKFLLQKPLIFNSGWVEQASGFWEASRGIDYVCAVDENIVWAKNYDGSGAGIAVQEFTRTINGGELWEADAIFNAPDDGELAMIFGLDADNAWVPIHSGDPQGIWHTSDGGDSWTQQTSADYNGVGAFPNIVHFWDEDNGWCQGDPVDGYFEMYTTTDGGANWIRVPTEDIPAPYSGEYGVIGYYDVVGDTIWWGTANAYPLRVFKSTDRGYTWTAADTPFDAGAYLDVRFKDQNNGLVMDKTAEGVGPIAESSDGGATWTLISYTGTCYNGDFDYVPGTDNMYVSTGVFTNDPLLQGASYSLDGGHSWTTWAEMEGTQLFGTDWIEGGIGWAGSFNVDEFTGGIWKYTPGENLPPGAPDIDGPTNGAAGTEYTYKFNAVDPDGDKVIYHITWGDGLVDTTDLGPSGTDVEVKHTYAAEGTYTITAYAEDENGLAGPGGTLNINMPRNRAVVHTFLQWVLEKFPNAFPILRYILGQ